jgi:Putative peptidoglycan binding domain
MNAEFEQEPSSISEVAVGAIALAVVALITFLGVRTSPPTASSTPASRSPDTTASVVVAAPAPAAETETTTALAETQRDLLKRFDVTSIQTKLRELGYYLGESDGVWGPGTRKALHDFKIMNGLLENEQWDRETEERLSSGRGIHAASTFIGIWAREAAECRNRAGDDQRIRIDARGAESAGTRCDFRSVNQEAAGRWQVRAFCSADRNGWLANISLKLTGSNLRWSSERGTETYLRCARTSSQ